MKTYKFAIGLALVTIALGSYLQAGNQTNNLSNDFLQKIAIKSPADPKFATLHDRLMQLASDVNDLQTAHTTNKSLRQGTEEFLSSNKNLTGKQKKSVTEFKQRKISDESKAYHNLSTTEGLVTTLENKVQKAKQDGNKSLNKNNEEIQNVTRSLSSKPGDKIMIEKSKTKKRRVKKSDLSVEKQAEDHSFDGTTIAFDERRILGSQGTHNARQ